MKFDKQKIKEKAKEYGQSLLIALILALLIKTTLVEATYIYGGSMEETLIQSDRVFVNKFIYGVKIPATIIDVEIFLDKRIPTIYHFPKVRNPRRGDVVVLTPPISSGKKDFIKRVIALEGETIEIKDKKVFINGRILSEPYKFCAESEIQPGDFSARDNFGPYTVPEGNLFVMGDNRDKSYDSRMFGPVPIENIRGKAVFVYWPLTRWNTL
ncbi:MAG: signal peptidase I [bacterium]